MYKLNKQIDGLSHGFWSMKSHVQIGDLTREEQEKHKSYFAVSFNNDYNHQFKALNANNMHCAANSMHLSDKKPCWPLYSVSEVLSLLLNKRSWIFGGKVLKGIEHWGALSPLCQIPMKMHFEKHCTPYDTGELSRVVDMIIEDRTPANNKYMTIDRKVVYQNPIDPKKQIIIQPLHRKKLIVKSYVDYRNNGDYKWIGQQEAEFDSTSENDVRDIARARTVSNHKWYNDLEIKVFRKFRHRTCLIEKEQQMDSNEIARHNILDYLVTTNHEDFFLAAEVMLNMAGHADHLALMKMLPEITSFVEVH